MANASIRFDQIIGKVKPMHAVNNGPVRKGDDQTRGNFDDFKAARIPFVRNHDASFNIEYGSEHTVDISAVFPDFSANPYDERSYDFAITDVYTQDIVDSGAEVFYRFGSKIEHWCRKYGTVVPADFHKWAVVCEHIIRHYNEGWANGFRFGIRYWEIWNEADGVKANGDQPNWTGTPQEYYELYETAATHLKQRFPHLKIGGPAISSLTAWNNTWLDGFLSWLTRDGRRVPLDFFSWHFYGIDPAGAAEWMALARRKLDEYGYTRTESILNEWNYIEDWTDRFVPSVEAIIGMRGAAFAAAMMAEGQRGPVDMMMYYDARPSIFNGMFDFYTMRPLKGYYPFVMYADLFALGDAVEASSDDPEIRVVAAADGPSRAAMISYYALDAGAGEKVVSIPVEHPDGWTARILDANRTMEEIPLECCAGEFRFVMPADSVVFVRCGE